MPRILKLVAAKSRRDVLSSVSITFLSAESSRRLYGICDVATCESAVMQQHLSSHKRTLFEHVSTNSRKIHVRRFCQGAKALRR